MAVRRGVTLPVAALAVLAALVAVPAEAIARPEGHLRGGAFDPSGKTVHELADALDDGEVTSRRLVKHYLARIDGYDRNGPKINSIIKINKRALGEAARLDAERAATGPRGPLHGIPIVVKDNIDVKGMPTTGGSVALANARPRQDAAVTRELVKGGAIVLAKANMSELAASYGWLGYSSVRGLTLNPYHLGRNAAGSSSGSAAAVAADLAALGIGTDTSGSVRAPATVTGLVGVRPTGGLVDTSGVIPLSATVDTAGPLARDVTDAAIALTALTGGDTDYAGRLDRTALRGARIGVATNFSGGNAEVDAIVARTATAMRRLGAEVTPVRLDARVETLWEDVLGPLGDIEFANDFEDYLAALRPGSAPATLPAVIERLEGSPVNPARLEGLRVAQKMRVRDGGPEHRRLVEKEIPRIRSIVDRHLDARGLDAIVFPTMTCPASPRYDIDDPTYRCEAADAFLPSYIGSVTGYPEVTLPAGADSYGLPVGVSFLGRAHSEQRMLDLAHSLETRMPQLPEPPCCR